MEKTPASEAVDSSSISGLVIPNTKENGIESCPAWRSVLKGWCEVQAGKLGFCAFGKSTLQDSSIFKWQTDACIMQSICRVDPV